MEKDFHIGQSNELVKGSALFDLHNQYDYSGYLLISTRRLYLFFSPNPIHGACQVPIAIEFEGVNFLELSPAFVMDDVTDLMEMGYKAPFDHDDNWLLREEQSGAADHLYFRFAKAAFIRICSQRAYLHEGLSMPEIKRKGTTS